MLPRVHYVFDRDQSNVGDPGLPLTCTRAGDVATYYDANGDLQVALANTLRHDHDPVTRRPLGVLCEIQSENVFLNSGAPVTQDITTLAQDYTVSVWGPGSVTLSGTATGVASEGSRLYVTATAGTLTCTVAGNPDRVQIEPLAFATSYIPTLGSSVIRPKDNIFVTDNDFYTDSDGTGGHTLYARGTPGDGDSLVSVMFTVMAGGSTYLRIYVNRGTDQIYAWSRNTTNYAAFQDPAVLVEGQEMEFLATYKAGDQTGYWEGSEISNPNVTATMPANCNQIKIGQSEGNGAQFCGHIAEVAYWNYQFQDDVGEKASLGELPGEKGLAPELALGFKGFGKFGR